MDTIQAIVEHPAAVLIQIYVVVPALVFLTVQELKRHAAPTLKRRLTDLEVRGLAFLMSLGLALFVAIGLYDLPLRTAAVHALLAALAYPAIVAYLMAWTKAHRPEVYQALRNDRRRHDTSLPSQHDRRQA